jgi:hypothetical protein
VWAEWLEAIANQTMIYEIRNDALCAVNSAGEVVQRFPPVATRIVQMLPLGDKVVVLRTRIASRAASPICIAWTKACNRSGLQSFPARRMHMSGCVRTRQAASDALRGKDGPAH